MSRVKQARWETTSQVASETSQLLGAPLAGSPGAVNKCSAWGLVAAWPSPPGRSQPGSVASGRHSPEVPARRTSAGRGDFLRTGSGHLRAPLTRSPEAQDKCWAWGLLAAGHQRPGRRRCSRRGCDSLCVSGAASLGRRGRRRRAPAARSHRDSCRAAPKPPPDCRRRRRSRPPHCARRTARGGSRGVRP